MQRARTSGSASLSRGLGLWRRNTPNSTLFDNAVLRELPIDSDTQNIRRSVVGACFSRIVPTPIKNPELVIAAPDVLRLVGVETWTNEEDAQCAGVSPTELDSVDSLTPYLAGNALFNGSETAAQCYCGHQFGFFSGQLGDGAVAYLGEIVTGDERWEMQLKGSGLTPFSRTADGRKVLRSTLREFLASEHMHALRIPTTRAASVVVSHETTVVRDMFYDGNTKVEPTAVVLRVARTFLRFGSFEIFKDTDPKSRRCGPSAQVPNKKEVMKSMLDFTIRQYFPSIWAEKRDVRYKEFFAEVVRRTAILVAQWQCIGFCHGVLNTDNMSIVGDTLDYGPYGFMEHFNPQHICNTSDDGGRYTYEAQPEICKWNCSVLADQLELVVPRADLDEGLAHFDETYEREYYRIMLEKLGLVHKDFTTRDRELVDSLFNVLADTAADFTCTYQALMKVKPFGTEESHESVVHTLVNISETLEQKKRRYSAFSDDQYDMIAMLLKKNPTLALQYGVTPVLFAQMTHEREQRRLINLSSEAERRTELHDKWLAWVERYSDRLKDESDRVPDVAYELHRHEVMRRVNPIYVLRNHVAQKAIDYATVGDYDQVAHILELLIHPFTESEDVRDRVYALPQPAAESPLCVSCSS